MELKQKTILLVEDGNAAAALQKSWLQEAGYNVVHVLTGEEAIDMINISHDPIDLILMDILLGEGIDGVEASRHILKYHDIPIVFLSAYSDAEILKRTEVISSYGFVLKSTSNTLLLNAIHIAFRLYEAQRELRQREQALKNSKFYLKESQRVARIGHYQMEFQSRKWIVSQMLSEIFGVNEELHLDIKNWLNIIHPKDRGRIRLIYEDLFKDSTSFDAEYRIIRPSDGFVIWIHDIGRITLDEEGVPVSMFGIVQDISQRKKTEEALSENEKNFRLLIENMGEGICFVDQDETFLFANPAAEEIFEVGKGELDSRNLNEFFDNEEFEKIIAETNKRKNGVKSVYELTLCLKSGHKKILLMTATPRFGHTGEFLGSFGIFRDVTEQREIFERLKESEQRINDIARNIPGIVYQYRIREDGSAYFSYISSKSDDFLDAQFNESSPETILSTLIPETDKERFLKSVAGSIMKEEPWEYEGQVICRGGELKWFHATALPTKSGNELVYNGILIDINDRKKAEIMLKKYSDELKAANASKDRMFSIIAHDLRGPFGGFVGLTETLSSHLDKFSGSELAECTEAMHTSSKKVYELLTNLLEWSRLQTGKVKLEPVSLNLSLEVHDIKELFLSSAKQKKISINSDIDEALFVFADTYSLSTILRNLVSNAVKFTPPAGEITLSAYASEGCVSLIVKDTGIGIPDKIKENILNNNSGYTTSGTSGEEGTGLGLALCIELAEKNNWPLSVKSDIGTGSEFILNLPQIQQS